MKLKQQHFYYGAILSAIIEYNPDAHMVLLQKSSDHRSIYQIQTNTSKDCVIYFKHANETKENKWQFGFTERNMAELQKCHERKIPTFIYLLCTKPNWKDSEIAILRLDEFRHLNKESIVVKIIPNSRNFIIPQGQSPTLDLSVPRNRITLTFDELIDSLIKESKNYYLPRCRDCMFLKDD